MMGKEDEVRPEDWCPGQLYLPKELRENVLDEEVEVEIHPSWGAGMLVPKGKEPERV